MANLLTICTRALDELESIEVPAYLFSNTDDTARQLIALAKKVGTELVRDYDWQEMTRTHTFTTTATDSYALPSDYERICPETFWDKSGARQIKGVASKRRWSALNAQIVSAAIDYDFRIAANRIRIFPTPAAGLTFSLEYLSKNYCTDVGGAEQAEWAADTDLAALPEDLFIAGVKFYFMNANGIAGAGDAEADYNHIITVRQGSNVPAQDIDLSAPVRARVAMGNIPDYVNAS